MNQCEIIRDLILLYIAGECSPASKEIVENHVKSCPDCGKYMKELQGPDVMEQASVLPEELEQKTKDFQVKKGMRKIKRRWIFSILCVLIVIPVITVIGILSGNQMKGEGVCFSNVDDLQLFKSYIACIQEEDYEKAFEYMDIEGMYDYMVNGLKTEGETGSDGYQIKIQCVDYYQSMGFETYKEKQWKKFMEQIQESKAVPIKINRLESYTISSAPEREQTWRVNAILSVSLGEGENETEYSELAVVDLTENGIDTGIPDSLLGKVHPYHFNDIFGLFADVDNVLGFHDN